MATSLMVACSNEALVPDTQPHATQLEPGELLTRGSALKDQGNTAFKQAQPVPLFMFSPSPYFVAWWPSDHTCACQWPQQDAESRNRIERLKCGHADADQQQLLMRCRAWPATRCQSG